MFILKKKNDMIIKQNAELLLSHEFPFSNNFFTELLYKFLEKPMNNDQNNNVDVYFRLISNLRND
jgi:hypothetical protein